MDDTDLLIELWKKTVDVQQHFNDIELRIRNIAITLMASVLGVAVLAVREGRPLVACAICGAGLIALIAFFLMDYVWYHRLLLGAVDYGMELEDRIAKQGNVPFEGLTRAIGRKSAYEVPRKWWLPILGGKELHSNTKMVLFYGIFAVPMLIGALGFGAMAVFVPSPPQESVQRIDASVALRDTIYIAGPSECCGREHSSLDSTRSK